MMERRRFPAGVQDFEKIREGGFVYVDIEQAQINERDYLIPYWNDRRRKVKVGVVVDPEARTLKEWKVADEGL